MADEFEQKQEEPTARKLEKAREEGQVARSREVGSLFFLISALLLFGATGHGIMVSLEDQMARGFSEAPVTHLTPDSVGPFLGGIFWTFLKTGFPLFGGFLVASVLAFLVQGAPVWSPKALVPKWDRVSPSKGMGRLLSGRSLIELAKYLLKVVLVMFVVLWSLRSDWERLPSLQSAGVHRFLGALIGFLRDALYRLIPLFVAIAILDFFLQRMQLNRSLRMSRSEIREEFKETEGDPHVRSRIRSIQRAMARRRMMAKVKTATVVVTNPTHFAVAIRYEPLKMAAPVVVAKGQDEVALNIRRIARESKVPVIENPPLARTLYAACPVDREIPIEFYQAVAEVLSVLYEQGRWEGMTHGAIQG